MAVWTGQAVLISVPFVFTFMAEDHVPLAWRLLLLLLLLTGALHDGDDRVR